MRWFRRDEPSEPGATPGPGDDAPPAPPPDVAATATPAAPAAVEPPPRPVPLDRPEERPRPDQVVLPVTRDRVERCLSGQGYRFRVGSDGSIGGNWDGNLFAIALIGPQASILQVRGTWSRTIEADIAAGVAQVVNDWNRDRIWPKAYTSPVTGGLHAHTEVSVDMGPGATDAQIAEAVACGLGTGVQFFALLDDLLAPPEPPLAP